MQAHPADSTRSGGSAWMLWAALGVALSPAIADVLRLAALHAWARGSLLMAALALTSMLRSGAAAPRRPGLGASLVALALLATLFAVGGGMTRLARPAIPLAVLGMALALGRPDPRRAALLFFAVAPPRALMDRLPGLHAWVGPAPLVDAPDGGLPLFWLLAGIGAWAGVRRGSPTRRVLAGALACGLLAVPIQLGALLAARALWQADHPDAARALLSHGVWTLSAGALLLHVHRQKASGSGVERQ